VFLALKRARAPFNTEATLGLNTGATAELFGCASWPPTVSYLAGRAG
jgi:hypothetical protein